MNDFMASMTASLSAVVLFSPLDVIKTKISALRGQCVSARDVLRTVYRAEGARGFYRGLGVTIVASPLSTSLSLSLYERCKQHFAAHGGAFTHSHSATSMLASVVSGFFVNSVTSPLWNLKSRLQAELAAAAATTTSEDTVVRKAVAIYKKEGGRAFFRGTVAGYFGLTHPLIYFPVYESMKNALAQHGVVTRKRDQVLAASVGAKFVSTVATYPQQLLQTAAQCCPAAGKLTESVRQIMRQHGVRGFYRGLSVEFARALPQTALIFVLYESLKGSSQ